MCGSMKNGDMNKWGRFCFGLLSAFLYLLPISSVAGGQRSACG